MKIKGFICIILSFLLTVGIGKYSLAQEDLSLSRAIEIGLANNFDVRIEKLNVDIAQNNNKQGEAGRFPTINFNVAQNNSVTNSDNPASFVQGTIINNSVTPSVTANWVIFNGFSVNIEKKRLELLQQQSEGNAALVIENTIQAIILAYYATLLEKERLEVFRETKDLSGVRYQYAELKDDLGSAVTYDVLREKNAFLTDSSNFITQELNYENAARNLNLLLGEPIETRYNFTDALQTDARSFDFADLSNKMTANNNNLRVQFLNQALFKNSTRQAQTRLFPRLDLSFGGSYTRNWQNLENAIFAGSGDPDDEPINLGTVESGVASYFANFTLSYTLFDGGRIRRQIKNARYQEEIGQLQVEQLKLSLNNDLLANYDLYEVRKKLFAIAEENLSTASLNLDLAKERYRNGTITSLESRDIQLTYLMNALTSLQSIYDVIETEMELMRLTGGILEKFN